MSNKTVTIVDYGMGNVLSVACAMQACGARVVLAPTPAEVTAAEWLVLPGVGAFGKAVAELNGRGLFEAVLDFARSQRPLLGICLGMQLLFDSSAEFGHHRGLGLLRGRVEPIPWCDADGKPLRVPHIGWSPVTPARKAAWDGSVLHDVAPGSRFYFVHSYRGDPLDATDCLALTTHGGQPLCAVVAKDNLIGIQAHPEKSGAVGQAFLARFLEA